MASPIQGPLHSDKYKNDDEDDKEITNGSDPTLLKHDNDTKNAARLSEKHVGRWREDEDAQFKDINKYSEYDIGDYATTIPTYPFADGISLCVDAAAVEEGNGQMKTRDAPIAMIGTCMSERSNVHLPSVYPDEDNVAEGEGEDYSGFSSRSDKGVVDSASDVKNPSQPQPGAFRVPGIGRQEDHGDDSEWERDEVSSVDEEDAFCPDHGACDDDDDDDDDKTNLPVAYEAELVDNERYHERRSIQEVVLAHAQIDTTRHLIQVLLVVCSLVLIILVILLPILLLVVRQDDSNHVVVGTPDADNVGAGSHTASPAPSQSPSQAPSQSPSQAPTMDSCPPRHVNYSNGFDCNALMNLELRGFATCETTTPNETHSSGGLIRLTGNSSMDQVGTAFAKFFFPDCNSHFSFTWQVQYHIDDTGGDGIALVLHQDPQGTYAYGDYGGNLGVYRDDDDTTSPIFIANALVIEMDIWLNRNHGDETAPAVQVVLTDDAGSRTSLIETSAPLLMTKTKAGNRLWVVYDGRNSQLHI